VDHFSVEQRGGGTETYGMGLADGGYRPQLHRNVDVFSGRVVNSPRSGVDDCAGRRLDELLRFCPGLVYTCTIAVVCLHNTLSLPLELE